MKIIADVTEKYYEMLNSFNADNNLKVAEIKENKIAYDKSFFEIEKDLIRNNNVRFMDDIELLNELEFDLRHEFVKIVKIDRDGENE